MAQKFPGNHVPMFAAYGLFSIAWSVLEIVIEVAITKQLGIDLTRGNIVTSGLGYERKLGILRSLLALHSPSFDDVIGLLGEITTAARRNAITHGQVRVTASTLTFIKRDTDRKLKASQMTFTDKELFDHVFVLNERVARLQSRLSISDEELEAFSNIGHSLANSSEISGRA